MTTSALLTMLHSGGLGSPSRKAPTTATVCSSTTSAPWGVHVVEFDQTGAAASNVDLILVEAPVISLSTMPDLEAAVAYPGAGRLRLDSRVSAAPAPARARL